MSNMSSRVCRLLVLNRNLCTVTALPSARNFHLSSVTRLKEIHREEKNGTITVKGVYVKSPREDYVLKSPNPTHPDSCTECPICRLGPGIHIRHTDVLILNQFVDSRGKQLPRSVTGLCRDQHKRLNYLIVMSRHAGLLPKRLPDGSVDPTESMGWKANNKYYDESCIDDFITSDRRKA